MNSSAAVKPTQLKGAQTPRVMSLPASGVDGGFGDRAVALADLAGLNLDPWQQVALRGMLRRDVAGEWAAFESCLLVPRQNGKSVDLEAFDLAKLYLSPPGHLILHTAHLFPTAMESFRHLVGLIRNTPELWAEVARVSNAHGTEGIELHNGSRLRFAARTVTGAGRGFSPDDVVLDEAFKLPHEALSALMPALSAKPNPQVVYASSTGYPDSEILWSLVERGRRGGDESLAYFEWSAEAGADLDDRAAWAAANPALGYRLTVKKIAAERASMRDEDFGRERLGLWADVTARHVIDLRAWARLLDEASHATGPLCYGVATSIDRAWSSIAVSGLRADGDAHVDVGMRAAGTDWVVAKCVELDGKHGPAVFVVDSAGPAASLVPALRAARLVVVETSAADMREACALLVDAVTAAKVRHVGGSLLTDAITAAVWRPVGDGGQAFGRRASTDDISALEAATLAHWCAVTGAGNDMRAINNVW